MADRIRKRARGQRRENRDAIAGNCENEVRRRQEIVRREQGSQQNERQRPMREVGVHHHDAYQALKAFLPPLERRGLVLMDPSFEQPNEFKQVIHTLKQAFMRWATGIYAIWYPIKNQHARTQFLKALRKCTSEEILLVELSVYPTDVNDRLNGSGMAIINPPWELDKTLETVLPWLWSVLSPNQLGGYELKWL